MWNIEEVRAEIDNLMEQLIVSNYRMATELNIHPDTLRKILSKEDSNISEITKKRIRYHLRRLKGKNVLN